MCGGARGSGENRGSEWATGLGFRVGGHIGHGVAGWAFAQLGQPAGPSGPVREGKVPFPLFGFFYFLFIFLILFSFSFFFLF